jgi:ubiquinone/menaquinone biosynthesis C-methylase UbiE
MSEEESDERRVTDAGNPAMPEGEYGAQMLERMNQSHSAVTNWALDFLSFRPGFRALDIGCGGGATMGRLLARIQAAGQGPEGHVTGVDYSEVSVAQSRALNAASIAAGAMDVVQASVEALPFAEALFDVVTTVESFYFWPDPEQNLHEVLRVLRPGGHFMLVADVYRKPGLSEQTLENIRKYNLYVLTPDEYRDLFRRVGFSSVRAHLCEGTDWIAVEGVR